MVTWSDIGNDNPAYGSNAVWAARRALEDEEIVTLEGRSVCAPGGSYTSWTPALIRGDGPTPDKYVDPEFADLLHIRNYLTWLGVPATAYLGAEFTRDVYRNLRYYFLSRNRQVSLNNFADDAKFRYHIVYRTAPNLGPATNPTERVVVVVDDEDPHSGYKTGERVVMELHITPSPYVEADSEYEDFVRVWTEWLQPYFASDGNLIVSIDPYSSILVDVRPGRSVHQHQLVLAEER